MQAYRKADLTETETMWKDHLAWLLLCPGDCLRSSRHLASHTLASLKQAIFAGPISLSASLVLHLRFLFEAETGDREKVVNL